LSPANRLGRPISVSAACRSAGLSGTCSTKQQAGAPPQKQTRQCTSSQCEQPLVLAVAQRLSQLEPGCR
jgi:hypothetical protein